MDFSVVLCFSPLLLQFHGPSDFPYPFPDWQCPQVGYPFDSTVGILAGSVLSVTDTHLPFIWNICSRSGTSCFQSPFSFSMKWWQRWRGLIATGLSLFLIFPSGQSCETVCRERVTGGKKANDKWKMLTIWVQVKTKWEFLWHFSKFEIIYNEKLNVCMHI